jgi:hypothetical protein
MNYSLEKISTVAACDALLILAQKKKQTLERRRRNFGESIGNFSNRIDHIGSELASVLPSLRTFTMAYDALPEGSMDKLCMNVEVKRLEVRKAQLDRLTIVFNVLSLLAKQVDYNKLDRQVQAIDTYSVAVQNRKTVLADATLRIGHTEPELLNDRSAKKTRFERNTKKLPSRAASFSRSAVVRQNQQPKKSSYNSQGHFSSLPVVHAKQQLKKRGYSSPLHFYQPHLKPKGMHRDTGPP